MRILKYNDLQDERKNCSNGFKQLSIVKVRDPVNLIDSAP